VTLQAGAQHRDDVRMRQAPGQVGLALQTYQPFGALGGTQVTRQVDQLQRHRAARAQVHGLMHAAATTRAQQGTDAVAVVHQHLAGDDGLRQRLWHGALGQEP